MKKKIMIIIAITMLGVCSASFASQSITVSEIDKSPVTRSVITSNFVGQLRSVDANTISVQYTLEARNIDKNQVIIQIQQYRNGRWMSISSNSYTEYSSYSYGVKEYSVSSNYTYRAKLTGKVYNNGTLIETSYVYTNEVDC